VHIAKVNAKRMLSGFDYLCGQVQNLMQASKICQSEEIICYEFLVRISNASADVHQQRSFLMQLLQRPMDRWTCADTEGIFSDPARFLRIVGVNEEEQDRLMGSPPHMDGSRLLPPLEDMPATHPWRIRIELLHCVMTLCAVFKAIIPPPRRVIIGQSKEDKDGVGQESMTSIPLEVDVVHPAAACVGLTLPNLFRILSAVNSLWRPDIKQHITPLQQTMLLPSREHMKLQLGERTDTLMHSVHKWLVNVLEHSCQLLSIACNMGAVFYESHDASQILAALFTDAQHLSLPHLRTLVEKFLVS
jgi:hypothetical protein